MFVAMAVCRSDKAISTVVLPPSRCYGIGHWEAGLKTHSLFWQGSGARNFKVKP